MGKFSWITWIKIITRIMLYVITIHIHTITRTTEVREQEGRIREEDAMRETEVGMMQLLEGSMSQGMWAASQSQKRQGNGFFSRGSEGLPTWHPILDF